MKYKVSGDGWENTFEVQSGPLGREWKISDPRDGTQHVVRVKELEEGVYRLVVGDEIHTLTSLPGNQAGAPVRFLLNDLPVELLVEDEIDLLTSVLGDSASAGGHYEIKSVMPGIVRGILVEEGDKVEIDTPLLLLEAMKMENEIRSPQAGRVTKLAVKPEQTVAAGELLVTIDTTNE